jgi:hypothetical protein
MHLSCGKNPLFISQFFELVEEKVLHFVLASPLPTVHALGIVAKILSSSVIIMN